MHIYRMLHQSTRSTYWRRYNEGMFSYMHTLYKIIRNLTSKQRICTSHPQLVKLPGSTVADIPVPDDMIPKTPRSPQTGYSVLFPFLQKLGRTIDRVLGDGNGLFHALSLQLTGIQDYHMDLRRIITQCESKIKAFQGLHATINQTTFADHLKNIGKTCIWGTNLEIIVTATLFGIDIYVATDSYRPGSPTWLKYSPNSQATTELRRSSISDLSSTIPTLKRKQWLELSHVSRCHFDAVKPVSGTQICRPLLQSDSPGSSETVQV